MTINKKIYPLLIWLFLFMLMPAAADESQLLSDGIDLFRQGLYKEGIINFRDILVNPDLKAYHGDAYFWISKSYMVLGKLEEAEKNLEYYLEKYKSHSGYSEAIYQKGRLLFMQGEYESSIQILTGFTETYPNSIFLSNALFWIGESLYLLGKLDMAFSIFKDIVQNHASSYKYEAAKYRLSTIEFKKRENELLKLLKWSHMESLKSLENYQRKEKTYEQAIASYQKKLAAMGNTDTGTLSSELAVKEAELKSLKDTNSQLALKIKALEDQILKLAGTGAEAAIIIEPTPAPTPKPTPVPTVGIAPTPTPTLPATTPGVDSAAQLKSRLLDAKTEALTLKEELLELLADKIGGQ